MILSERARRNSARRTNPSGGRVWKKHNPDTTRCRCADCSKTRAGKKKQSPPEKKNYLKPEEFDFKQRQAGEAVRKVIYRPPDSNNEEGWE